MEKALRNTLRIMVTQARKILEVAIQEQLQGVFGIYVNGNIEPATAMTHLSSDDQGYREQLLIHLQHIRASGFTIKDAIAQLIREVSYTHLNRLSAYKMMEKRKIIPETVSRGLKSRGFIFYVDEHSDEEKLWSSGKQDVAYRHFLEWRGEKLSEEIGVLFSSSDPANRLFPSQRVLDEVLALINSDALQDIWSEDETLGWIYQYFTPKELRDKARNESPAPRNSYELAFRNQFYTPSYVVKFLTDNTLGRIWYEMRHGKTRLTEQCTYMVRRPDEVFFTKADSPKVEEAQRWLQGEEVPEPDIWSLAHTVNAYNRVRSSGKGDNEWVEKQLPRLTNNSIKELKTQELLDLLFLFCRKERFSESTLESLSKEIEAIMTVIRERVREADKENRSQEELLRAPFFITYRPLKDPRTLKILDPACGSGHFLLYCFEVLEIIYLEAYDAESLSGSLKQGYATMKDLQSALPELILAHNLHGIDIDIRATQIASLALWLRCQRAYQDLGMKSDERLKITRSNIVCAEPMPGEMDLLEEFTATLQPKILGTLVETVFDKMRLASEAGSLLKIEVEIKEAILEAKQLWLRRPKAEQLVLWSKPEKFVQQELINDVEITDLAFWNEAESRVINALHKYAIGVSEGEGLARRLFADNVVQGFAFIDICQKLFDVVLMNPPFGETSKPSKMYIDTAYLRTRNDIYASFVERWLDKLNPRGLLGAITSRTGFFLSSFQVWREEILLKEAKPIVFADLGEGVLDTAMVETAAYCLIKEVKEIRKSNSAFLRILDCPPNEKSQSLLKISEEQKQGTFYIVDPNDFCIVPGSPFCYWVTHSVRTLFSKLDGLESNGRENRVGLQTSDNFRFLNTWWEVSSSDLMYRWYPYAKGGGYSPYYRDIPLCVDWANSGSEIKAYARSIGNSPSRSVRSEDHYFRPGITYSDRCSGGFATSPMPRGCIFDVKGSSIFVHNDSEEQLFITLGITLSVPFRSLLTLRSGTYSLAQSFQVGQISSTPFAVLDEERGNQLRLLAKKVHDMRRSQVRFSETSHTFSLPALVEYRETEKTLSSINNKIVQSMLKINALIDSTQSEIDTVVWKLYGFSEEDRKSLLIEKMHLVEQIKTTDTDAEETLLTELTDHSINAYMQRIKDFIQWSIGVGFGRWDVREALSHSLVPELQQAFDPLPICSPGMLLSPNGLPANSGNIVSEEWLLARPDAITLPEKGSVKYPTILNSDYPITINWNGILVDDPGHPEDIIRRVQAVLKVIWQGQADTIEQEICHILDVKGLREYFHKSGNSGLWPEHIQHYSKSRRKAPIYWLLQSSKKSYAVWLYYHRLNKDTLFKVLNTVVEPKIRLEETQLEQLRLQLTNAGTGGREVKQLEQLLERQENFISELEDFRDKLRRAADLNLEPDLNDGVVLNIAPLWELVPWKEAKRYWQELLAGKYEWSTIGKQLRERGLV